MNSNGKFLTLEEFQNKFEIKVSYLHYFQLIAAIPPDLKRKAFDSTVPDLLGATSENCQMEDRTIVLTKFYCKNYYNLFIEKLAPQSSAVRAWKKSFSNFLIGVIVLWICISPRKITSLDNSLLRLCTTQTQRKVWKTKIVLTQQPSFFINSHLTQVKLPCLLTGEMSTSLVSMLWSNFILGSNFISLCFWVW